jgi:hypothetical protein
MYLFVGLVGDTWFWLTVIGFALNELQKEQGKCQEIIGKNQQEMVKK